jgi:hypothetical protein
MTRPPDGLEIHVVAAFDRVFDGAFRKAAARARPVMIAWMAARRRELAQRRPRGPARLAARRTRRRSR